MPAGLPSTLLQRRPDIAAAERNLQALNAQIGVQVAAYYPDISLSALGEVAGYPLGAVVQPAEPFLVAGRRGVGDAVQRRPPRRRPWRRRGRTTTQAVANYRQTVLTAFQQVEDALSSLRILEQQADAQALAVNSARRAVTATLNAYRAGTVPIRQVIVEQATLLGNEQTALSVQQSRLVQSVSLIQALGGGWNTGDVPTREQMPVPSALVP